MKTKILLFSILSTIFLFSCSDNENEQPIGACDSFYFNFEISGDTGIIGNDFFTNSSLGSVIEPIYITQGTKELYLKANKCIDFEVEQIDKYGSTEYFRIKNLKAGEQADYEGVTIRKISNAEIAIDVSKADRNSHYFIRINGEPYAFTSYKDASGKLYPIDTYKDKAAIIRHITCPIYLIESE